MLYETDRNLAKISQKLFMKFFSRDLNLVFCSQVQDIKFAV